jgi:DNA-binding GntR family transcriptional regulator
MPILFAKLPKHSLRQHVASKLRQAILHGSPKPGERLVERKLAIQFGASVPVIREALVQLEAEGLVAKSPSSSCCVTQYSLEDVEQAFALRRVLEGYAMQEATRRATPEQVRSLESLYLDMLDTARGGDSMLYLRRAYGFKQYIWEIAGNRFLAASLGRLVQPQFAFLSIRLHTGETLDLIQDAYLHLPLLEAIRSKDVEASRHTTETVLDEMSRRTRSYAVTQSSEHGKERLQEV